MRWKRFFDWTYETNRHIDLETTSFLLGEQSCRVDEANRIALVSVLLLHVVVGHFPAALHAVDGQSRQCWCASHARFSMLTSRRLRAPATPDCGIHSGRLRCIVRAAWRTQS
jgi:hypothetical protein